MPTPRVLLAEDNADHRRLLELNLREAAPDADLTLASSRREFLDHVRHGSFDCVVIDFNLGTDTAADLLREAQRDLRDTPAVIISSSDEQSVVIDSLRRGAADYVPKDAALSSDALWRRIQAAIQRSRAARLDRRRATRRIRALRHEADTDALTGLFNRRYAARALHSERLRHDRREHTACILLDIDHFKRINDTLGHDAGDTVLTRVAQVIREETSPGDTAVRWGGEEFLVLRPSQGLADAWCWAERLRQRLASTPIEAAGQPVHLTVSAGVALVPTRELCDSSVTLADEALFLAKEHGRDRVCTADMARMYEAAESCQSEAAQRAGERARQFLGCVRTRLGPTQQAHLEEHSERVGRLAARLGASMGLPPQDVAQAEQAARLHDLGKVCVPESLLAKEGPYTSQERLFVAEHGRFGADLAEALAMPAPVVETVRRQQDRYDQRDDRAPVAGIVAVADAYDAMTSGRPHAAVRTPAAALAELRKQRGKQFDPDAVDGLHFVSRQELLAA